MINIRFLVHIVFALKMPAIDSFKIKYVEEQ